MDQWLNPSLVASSLRIIPQIYPVNPVCLRFELFGCNFTQGTTLIYITSLLFHSFNRIYTVSIKQKKGNFNMIWKQTLG